MVRASGRRSSDREVLDAMRVEESLGSIKFLNCQHDNMRCSRRLQESVGWLDRVFFGGQKDKVGIGGTQVLAIRLGSELFLQCQENPERTKTKLTR